MVKLGICPTINIEIVVVSSHIIIIKRVVAGIINKYAIKVVRTCMIAVQLVIV
jgi:hypothetical protein